MPELPEVEALRRGLVQKVVGSKILNVQVLNEKLVAGKGTNRKANKEKTKEFVESLKNKKIVEIKRRAKNLIFVLNTKEIILVHLKMTGQLVFVPIPPLTLPINRGRTQNNSSPINRGGQMGFVGGHPIQESETSLPHKHTYIIFQLDNGTLYYNDVRQFGYCLYYKNEDVLDEEKHFENIGMEPFDKKFTLKYFKEHLCKTPGGLQRTTPIKKVLLDQEVVVGCGNIYCDEVLWASSVLPTRPVKSLSDKEIEKIYKNILKILDKAINSGGSSVANYLLADGKRGNYTDYHKVYKKQGQRCTHKITSNPSLGKEGKSTQQCTGIIKKITFAGRGTHFCSIHQK